MKSTALRVLHIEDDEMDAELMQEMIMRDIDSRNCITIDHASSLQAALKRIERSHYNAILLDLNLIDVMGIDNVRAIHNQCPEIPIIVLSSIDDNDMAIQTIEEGAQEYLVKGHANSKVVNLAIHSSIRRKAAEQALYRKANYDRLTELPNQLLFMEHVETSLRKAKRWGKQVAVLFVDLNGFKQINDTYGHASGDKILKEAAFRFQSALRSTDIICRYGGDEFLILLDEHNDAIDSAIGAVMGKIERTMQEPFYCGNDELILSASVGVALYPRDGDNAKALIESADHAMYRDKRSECEADSQIVA